MKKLRRYGVYLTVESASGWSIKEIADGEYYKVSDVSDNASSPKLPTLDQFVKEAKRFQKEGDTLGGVTLIDIIEHLHEFAFRKSSPKLPKSYAESEKLFLEWWHTGSRADTLSRKNMQMFYEIVVGNNGH